MTPLHDVGKCIICKNPTIDRCSSCHNVFYCSKEHQKLDWPKHRQLCRPYEIKSSPEQGTYLVAARNIKVNDVIISELPLAIGQDPRGEHFDSCIGCSREIETLGSTSICENCNWPTCRRSCPGLTDPARHVEECPYIRLFKTETTNVVPWEVLFLPFRVMLLQKRDPKKWTLLQELGERAVPQQDESMLEKLHNNIFVRMLRTTLVLITQSAPHIFKDSSDEALQRVYSLLDVYGTRLAKPAGAHILALYPVALYLRHDCLPNTITCFEAFPKTATGNWRGRITVRAIKDIPKEVLTVIHTNGQWCSKERQDELLMSRGIRCKCARCMDPTELGLHSGTLKCPKCPGWVLPTDTMKIESCLWQCTRCGRKADGRNIEDLSSLFWGAMNIANPKGIPRYQTSVPPTQEKVEELLKKSREFLHPNHQICLSAKVLLVASYSNDLQPDTIKKFSDEELEKRAALCKDVVKALNEIGYSHNRLAMYASESLLQATRAEVELLKRRFKSKVWNKKRTAKAVIECRAQLRKVLVVLRAETNDTVDDQSFSTAAFDDRALSVWAKEKKIDISQK